MKLSTFVCIVVLASCSVPSSAEIPWPMIFKLLSFGVKLMVKDTLFKEDKVSIPNMINDISTSIHNMEKMLKQSEAMIIHEVDRLINYHQTMHVLTVNGVYIDDMFDHFQTYSKNGTFENSTLLDFARSATSHASNQLPSIVNLVYRLVKPTGRDAIGLFDLLTQDRITKEQQARICNGTMSQQQDVFLLYNIVGMYMVKGFTMKLYSYHILREFGVGQYTTEIAATKKEFGDIMSAIGASAIDTLKVASRDIRPCDAKINKEGDTFLQLKWLFGIMNTNVIYLNEKKSCMRDCKYYPSATFYQRNYKDRPDRCDGKIWNCFTQWAFRQCAPTVPHRRYNGIRGVNMLIGKDTPDRGNMTDCQESQLVPKGQHVRVDPLYPCHECFCNCDDYNYSETVRTFSLKGVHADTEQNMVITGVRFVERKRVFHIQIQQGRLGPNGTIDVSTVHWKPVDEFDYTAPSEQGQSYTVKWDNNGLVLDSYVIDSGSVLTGVKFEENQGKITLGVMYNTIKFEEGLVRDGDSGYYYQRRIDQEEIEMDEPHIPTVAEDESIVNVEDNKFIRFRQTDWYKDASQTAIPFLDAQPVVSNPPVPLGGIGVFYKTLKGYGGYIGLKVISYDYSKLVEVPAVVRQFSGLMADFRALQKPNDV